MQYEMAKLHATTAAAAAGGVLLAVVAVLASTCDGWGGGAGEELVDVLRLPAGLVGDGGYCGSWRVGVEANNVRDWTAVPRKCPNYVENYMRGHKYKRDSEVAVDEAIAYAEGLKLSGEGKEVWVFDVDETALSNIHFFKKNDFDVSVHGIDKAAFLAWIMTGKATALENTVRLYKKLLILGIKPVFITDRPDSPELRNITATNLVNQGFCSLEDLILRSENSTGLVVEYKSEERKKLEEAGMVIVGNIGDQWSDLLGASAGQRTFKLPNALYYVP